MANDKTIYIKDVLGAQLIARHGNCAKAVLYQSDLIELSVFSVNPGASLKGHKHTKTWDMFFGLTGHINIEARDALGHIKLGDIVPRALFVIPPGCVHYVKNLLITESSSFLLLHVPWEGYDFITSE